MKSALATLKNISIKADISAKEYLLTSVNWKIEDGSCWILDGEQNSGKEEILQVASGLKRPAEGILELLGKNYWNCNNAEMVRIRQKVAYFFKRGTHMLGELTLKENIILGYCYHENVYAREMDSLVTEIMDSLGIVKFADDYPSHLQLHQRYKGAFARLFLTKPRMLFVDMFGIDWDFSMQKEFCELLKRVYDGIPEFGLTPVTMIISVPNNHFRVPFATHRALIRDGKLILTSDS